MRYLFFIILLVSTSLFISCDRDPCKNLNPCEQYVCLNPDFYCSDTLYHSGIIPKSLKSAEKIVLEYVSAVLNSNGKVLLSARLKENYHWYQVTISLDDQRQYGYEVGPDGNIYEIKREN